MTDRLVTALGISASVLLIAASMAINAEFAYSRGTNEHQALTYAVAAAAADLLKALFALFALRAVQSGDYVRAGASLALATLVTLYSLTSAIGLIAESRDARATEREQRNAALSDLRNRRSDTEAELSRIVRHRSVTEIVAAIDARRSRPVMAGQRVIGTVAAASQECAAVSRATRDTCTELGALREELGRAKRAEELRKQLDDLRTQQSRLHEKGAGQESDGHVRVLAQMLRREIGEMNIALAILLALVIEAGSSLGLFVTTGPRLGSARVPIAMQEDVGGEQEPAEVNGIALKQILPVLAVEDYWMARLFPSPGTNASFSEIFADYQAHCAELSLAALDAEPFERLFAGICEQIGLKTANRFALGVRIGEEASRLGS